MRYPKEMTSNELDIEIENRKTWVEKELDKSIEKRMLWEEKARRIRIMLEKKIED